jgi:hypothetical protein
MDALIQSKFPKDSTSPFSLNKNSLNLIYKVYDIHVYIDKSVYTDKVYSNISHGDVNSSSRIGILLSYYPHSPIKVSTWFILLVTDLSL